MRCLGDGWHGIGGGRRADRPGAPALEWAPRLIGDGTNLAHQVAHVFFGNAAGQILDRDDRGHVYVFRSTADRLGELTLADADVVIDGAGEVDGFGRLPVTPRLDINAGRHDDLLVGGAGIADLTGLGIATNLRHLNLTGNSVADLSELRSRTDL